jgi:PAS domain S-box-containing protein
MSEPVDLLGATRALLEATSRTTGDDFFRGLVRGAAHALKLKGAVFGSVTAGEVVTRALYWDRAFLENIRYPLEGAPCGRVAAGFVTSVPSRAQTRYPECETLRRLGVESYHGIPVRRPGGEVVGILAALHESTSTHVADELETILSLFADRAATEMDRIAVEERLRASEARFRQLLTASHDGVWAIDAEGKTTYVNDRMATMLGYLPEEMAGRTLFDFMDQGGREAAQNNMDRRRRGIAERHDFCFQTKDGRDIWMILSTAPLTNERGDYEGAVATAADVTERRSLELKIQHAQKLESLAVLAGGIAHDFNNLLVAILGNVGLALMTVSAESPLVPTLEDIQTAATRAADLTRQMLAYSGKGRFLVQVLSVNRIIEEISHLLSSVVSKRATIRFQLDPTIPEVKADATQLRQIVMNLITNASDALEDKEGIITVTTGTLVADRKYLDTTFLNEDLRDGEYVYLEVADTGIGMDKSTQERIFDPFFSTKFTGRGLGLAAVLGILREHHGAVKVYSEVGRGTTFRVLLPAVRTNDTRPVGTAGDLESPDGERGEGVVLVADDEPSVRALTAQILSSAGYQVIVASDGEQALSIFKELWADIRLVLLDMMMPRVSGEEVFRRMRVIDPSVRVLLSSGYGEEEAMTRFRGKGLSGFLRKPWKPTDLLSSVRDALLDAREESGTHTAFAKPA